MRQAKLSTNFTPYADAEFKIKAASILESMENNAHFPDPIPTLESIRILYEAYAEVLEKAMGMDRVAIVKKNTARKELAHELARLSLYVMYIADGNEAILTSSGFSLTKKPAVSYISSPGTITITNGITSGELTSSVKAVKGAKTYIHEITSGDPADENSWKGYTSSRRSYTYKDLKPGTRYYMRVVVLGTGNQRTVSPVADKWAQ